MDFDREVADKICERIMAGRSLRDVCRDQDIPSRFTVYKWLAENDSFADQYARATDVRTEELADEIFEIADDASNDWMTNAKGDKVLNAEHVQRSRLRIDARRWALSKMNPRKYGDKLQVGGAEDLAPIRTQRTLKIEGLGQQELEVLEKVLRASLPAASEEDQG